jgi:5-methylcytosine-specific restriction endonuclease McrA
MMTKREKIKNMFSGHCAYCGNVLGDKWHIDHVKPIIRGHDIKICEKTGTAKFVNNGKLFRPENNNDDNLFPACVPCNIHKSTLSVEGFRKYLQDHIKRLNDKTSNHSAYRHAKRFGLVQETGNPVVFYFEKETKNDE